MERVEPTLEPPASSMASRPHACAAPSATVADPRIEALADELAILISSSELQCAFEVGRRVAERIFDGDPAAWHRHGPKRDSLARVAAALALRGVGSASALHVCLGIYETLQPLGVISAWERLSRSHVRAVLPLPIAERRILLQRAEEAGWSVRQLEDSVRRAPRQHRLGRRAKPAFCRAIRAVIKALSPQGPAFQEIDRVAELPVDESDELYQGLSDAGEQLELLMNRLRPKRVAELRARAAFESEQARKRAGGGPRTPAHSD